MEFLEIYYKIITIGTHNYLLQRLSKLIQVSTNREENDELFSVLKEANTYKQ